MAPGDNNGRLRRAPVCRARSFESARRCRRRVLSATTPLAATAYSSHNCASFGHDNTMEKINHSTAKIPIALRLEQSRAVTTRKSTNKFASNTNFQSIQLATFCDWRGARVALEHAARAPHPQWCAALQRGPFLALLVVATSDTQTSERRKRKRQQIALVTGFWCLPDH